MFFMRKLIVGLFVALGLGAGAYFSAVYWAERTAARQIDAMLDHWRSGGGAASRGRLAFDLWTRTLRVADVALQSSSAPDEKIAIDELVAVGIDPSGRARRLDLVGLQTSHALPGLAGVRVEQKAPRVTLTDFSKRPRARTGGGSPLDAARRWLEQFSAIAASSIEVPSLTVTMTPAVNGWRPDVPGPAEYVYTNLVLRDVADGRVAEATVDQIAFSGSGRMNRGFAGEMAKASVSGIDMGPVLALLDPSRPRDKGYRRVYREMSAGPYTVRFGDGVGMRVDKLAAEEIGLHPDKLSLDNLVFLMEVAKPGTAPPPTPGQLSMLIDKIAGLYEGIHFGKFEMQGVQLDTLPEGIKIAGIALNGFDHGRLAELVVERLAGQTPAREALAIGHMSVKGLHIAKLLRTTSTQMASVGLGTFGPHPLLAMLGQIEGVELRDAAVPDPKTGRLIRFEAFDASWGQLVGGIPSEARVLARMSGPIGPDDSEAFVRALAARGIASMAAGFDLGVRWKEPEQSIVLAPATMEIRDVLALSIKASIGNVSREMLSTDMLKVIGGVPLVEAGPVEVNLRDLGVVELAAANLGQARGGDVEAGRALLVESLAQRAAAVTQGNPELQPFVDALRRFLQGKGETLTVTLTPKGSVGLLQFIEAARRDAVGTLLTNFTVEARTGG
jgi:hypothetical protein